MMTKAKVITMIITGYKITNTFYSQIEIMEGKIMNCPSCGHEFDIVDVELEHCSRCGEFTDIDDNLLSNN